MITIDDGTETIYNQTGKVFPTNIRSSNSELAIHFTSGDNKHNGTEGENGFEIKIEYILAGYLDLHVTLLTIHISHFWKSKLQSFCTD